MDGCPECGFTHVSVDADGWHYDESAYDRAASEITSSASEAVDLQTGTDETALRARPRPDVWSALEYACHIRDVLLVQRERVLATRRGFGHEVTPMGRDERVEHDGYNEQRPEDVAVQLHHAALLFTGDLARLDESAWDLAMTYTFPSPSPRPLRWVAVHTAHEVVHHAHDMRRSLAD